MHCKGGVFRLLISGLFRVISVYSRTLTSCYSDVIGCALLSVQYVCAFYMFWVVLRIFTSISILYFLGFKIAVFFRFNL